MSKMSAARHEKHLLLAAAVVLGFLLGHACPGRVSNLSIGPRFNPTRTWAFFLLPGTMWGRVGSQAKQNVLGRPGQDSNVAFVGDVDSSNVYKEKPVNEQSDKSQIPPLYKDPKTVCSNNYALLRSAWVIMAIILMVVLGVMALYYWLLFYPIVCKKERKYDVMQMSAKP